MEGHSKIQAKARSGLSDRLYGTFFGKTSGSSQEPPEDAIRHSFSSSSLTLRPEAEMPPSDPSARLSSEERIEESSSFTYERLNPNVDCIRLLTLLPAPRDNDPIVCILEHVEFRQIPKYEAISYTWGDSALKRTITVNGFDIEIGFSLHNALKSARSKTSPRVLWADALCINQADVYERSRQLRIMPFIYQRAQAVLVMLAQDVKGWGNLWQTQTQSQLDSWFLAPTIKMLCDDAYWRRVWIIQEISLARKVFVYYGGKRCTWGEFVSIVSQGTGDSIPERLQWQLERKFGDGHRLHTLLKSHKDALCQEPRDKVYGFIGLASDCLESYPLDYRKTLFEVWKDAVMYMNAKAQGEFNQVGLLEFGLLVKEVLGGDSIASKAEVARDINLRLAQPGSGFVAYEGETVTYKNAAELLIPSRVAGRIAYLGPPYENMISDLKQAATWRENISLFIHPSQRERAMEENESFLRTLEELKEGNDDSIKAWERQRSWKPATIPDSLLIDSSLQSPIPGKRLQETDGVHPHNVPPISLGTYNGPRVFLLTKTSDDLGKSGSMGVAPPEAKVGDFICQLHGTERAVVVRMEGQQLRIVGTAGVTRNADEAREMRDEQMAGKRLWQRPSFERLSAPERLDLFVDVAIAYQLLG